MLFTYAYLGWFAMSQKAPVTFILSVSLSSCIGAAPTGRFDIEILSSDDKFQVWLKSDETIGHFALRLKYSVLLPAMLNRHKNVLLE
jgi:hypothetical protein